VNNLAGQLALAIRNESPEILRHVGLLRKFMKLFMQFDLSEAVLLVN
jgi:hypothetical protein